MRYWMISPPNMLSLIGKPPVHCNLLVPDSEEKWGKWRNACQTFRLGSRVSSSMDHGVRQQEQSHCTV